MKQILFLLSTILIATITYSQPGSIDETFGDKGFVYTKTFGIHRAIAQQQDGKLLVAGGYNKPPGNVARFLPDGTIDSSFGTFGFAGYPPGGDVYDMILQANDKILTVGTFLDKKSQTQNYVARYQPNGTFDSSFGENGITFIPNFGDYSGYNRIRLEPDNNIIIAGAGLTNLEYLEPEYMLLCRLSADGIFYYSFGKDGRVLKSFFEYTSVNETSLAIEPDGKILLGGYINAGGYDQEDYVLCRYNKDGTPDNSFGSEDAVITQGVQGLEEHDEPCGIVVQPDGKIVVGGTSAGYDFITYMSALRYEPDGMLDKSFGTNGRSFVSFEGKVPHTGAILMQLDGKFILAGEAFDNLTSDFALCRLNKDGSLDSSFAVNGKQLTPFTGGNVEINSCATLQQDGKVVQGGSYYNDKRGYSSYLLVRYNGDKEQQSLIARIKQFLHNHGISWQGLDNKNINYYSIQYSPTGKGFAEKGKLSGAGSSRLQDYNFNVADAGFYRIVAVDKRGYKTFSNKVTVSAGDLAASASVYPNPVRDYVTVQGLKTGEQSGISIANGSGTVLAKGVSNGSTQYRAPAANLQPGTYYLHITSGSKRETLKFVKE